MRTRCPVCSTVFRATSEQLRLKAGKVRCGHCQGIFNAIDEALEDSPAPEEILSFPPLDQVDLPADALSEPFAEESEALEDAASLEEVLRAVDQSEPLQSAEEVDNVAVPPQPDTSLDPIAESSEERSVADFHDVRTTVGVEPALPAESPATSTETPEDFRLSAQAAGLVAAREMNAAPGYSRWAAGTLEGNGLGGFAADTPHRAVWPFVLASLLLTVALVGQLLFHFRTQVVQRWPSSIGLFQLAAVDVPLPRNSELVAIETSDLQSDNVRGLFVLQATLRNRASYPQAWPALELSLTDTNDTVVSRRVLPASVYLPAAADPAEFPANGEIGVKLWLEAKDIGAVGYRLYIFYP
jgi:predicted Zn finger-like uncharacterized protein